MALTKPNTFTSGATAQSSQVNDNFDVIYTAVGSQEYTSQNYVTNDETVTASLNALDQQIKTNADAIGVSEALSLPENASLPVTVSNTPQLLSMEGATGAESIPIFARENAGGALTMLCGDTNMKIWAYINTATPLWIVDSTITDAVIALKGGAQAYNVDGGNPDSSATWSHTHTDSGHAHSHAHANDGGGHGGASFAGSGQYWTDTDATSGTASISTVSTFRPKAAVGILQYPDVN